MNESGAVDSRGLLIHYFGPADQKQLAASFRSARNAAAAMREDSVEVVVQGPAVALLVHGSPLAETVGEAFERGIAIAACGNSMKSAGVELDNLLPGVVPVPAAVAHLAHRQWDGWAYVRL